MGNFTAEETLLLTPSTTLHHPSPEIASIAQSDASESISHHNRIHTSNKNPISSGPLPPPTTIISSSEEWTSATIVLTAVISSFIAIILVLLLILSALLFRAKLLSQGKIPGSRTGTLDPQYENHHLHHPLDFGIGCIAPECKSSSKGSEYQEPFADPQFSSFVVASNGYIGHTTTNNSRVGSSSGNSNNGSNGKMAEYYGCTLVSNPLSRVTPLLQQQQQNPNHLHQNGES